jgi:L-amino acid N-acyltransferase YncA
MFVFPTIFAGNTDDLMIRPYTEDDIEAIADIYNQSILKGNITMDCHLHLSEFFQQTFSQKQSSID